MSGAVCTVLDGKEVRLYPGSGDDLPVIFSNDFGESGTPVRQLCERAGCPPFHLVTVSGMDWDSSLSPWPSEAAVAKDDHFNGNAPEYLKWFLGRVVPYAEETLELKAQVPFFISGYSMAGLFALWSLYETGLFSGAVCASGSLWYPGFCEYALHHEFRRKPAGIYLSLGDRESSAKNPMLQKTESVFRTLNEHYLQEGCSSVFELNPGNHYRDAELRMAKGYRWILSQKGAEA